MSRPHREWHEGRRLIYPCLLGARTDIAQNGTLTVLTFETHLPCDLSQRLAILIGVRQCAPQL
jgi:hypothetical protein